MRKVIAPLLILSLVLAACAPASPTSCEGLANSMEKYNQNPRVCTSSQDLLVGATIKDITKEGPMQVSTHKEEEYMITITFEETEFEAKAYQYVSETHEHNLEEGKFYKFEVGEVFCPNFLSGGPHNRVFNMIKSDEIFEEAKC